MTQDSANSGGTDLDFPVPIKASRASFQLGNGFNPILGSATSEQGFSVTAEDTKINDDNKLNQSDSDYKYVSDKASFEASVNYLENAHGHGWGASASESVAAAFSTQFSMQNLTVYYYVSALEYIQSIDKTTMKLSPTAAEYFKSVNYDYKKFCEKYGTHFISAVTKGSGCYLTYALKFMSMAAQASYSENLKEHVKELGVGESASEQLNAAATASGQHFTVDAKTHFYGFNPKEGFENVDQMTDIVNEFYTVLSDPNRQIIDSEIVKVTVSPWFTLDNVLSLMTKNNPSSNLFNDPRLETTITDIYYLQNTAQNFLDGNLFAGKSQYDAVTKLLNKINKLKQDILSLAQKSNNGQPSITFNQITQFQERSKQLNSDYMLATSEVSVSWRFSQFTSEKYATDTAITAKIDDAIITENQDGTWEINCITKMTWPNIENQTKSGPNTPKISFAGGDYHIAVLIKNQSFLLQVYNLKASQAQVSVGGNMNYKEVANIDDINQKAVSGNLEAIVI